MYLDRWYRRACLQGRSRDTDVEHGPVDPEQEQGEWDEWGGQNWHVYTVVCKIDSSCEAAV